MNDKNPLSDIEDDNVDHLMPEESTPPGAIQFSAAEQQGKFLQAMGSGNNNSEKRTAAISIRPERLTTKTDGAFSIVSRFGQTSREAIEREVTKRANHLNQLLISEGGSGYDLTGVLGETKVDQHGTIIAPEGAQPKTVLRLVTEYAGTEAAIASLYTSTPDVESLPPEAYRLHLNNLSTQIDEIGVFLPIPNGGGRPGIKTRFYRIPSQQLDQEKKLIPPYEQKVLVVQDTPRHDGILRTYTINVPGEIEHYLPQFVEAQKSDGQTEKTTESEPIVPKEDKDARIQTILDKLSQNFPSEPGGVGRLGIEITMTESEIADVINLLRRARGKLSADPNLQKIRQLVAQNIEDKAFQASNFFGHAVIENQNLSEPQVIKTESGQKIAAPPEVFRLYKMATEVNLGLTIIHDYTSKPLESQSGNLAYGTSSRGLSKAVQTASNVMQSPKEN